MDSRRSTAFSLTLIVLVSACTGDSPAGPSGNDSGNGTGNGGSSRTPLDAPSFQADINEIFVAGQNCTAASCHGGGEAGLTLTSSAGANYANLVNVRATLENFLRVAPGDAQNSYLVIKLEGRQAAGSRMPLTGCCLDDIDIGNIRKWIDNGAPEE